jgi:hypothetical protein
MYILGTIKRIKPEFREIAIINLVDVSMRTLSRLKKIPPNERFMKYRL